MFRATLLMTLAATPIIAADQPLGDTKLAARFATYIQEECRRRPSYATALGNHEFDADLEILTAESLDDDRKRSRELLEKLPTEFPAESLSPNARIDLEIWLTALKLSLWQAENVRDWETDPRAAVALGSDTVYALFSQSTVSRPRAVTSAAGRIAKVPAALTAAGKLLKNPPKILTEVAIRRALGAAAFYETDLFALSGETATTSELTAPAKLAAKAFRDYAEFLKTDLLPRSTGDWRLGETKFAEKFALELDAGVTPREVVALAESEATRVEAEMAALARQLWAKFFFGEALPPDDMTGRRELVSRVLAKVAEDRPAPDTLLAEANAGVAGIKAFITKANILALPEPDRCQVIEMPEFQRGFSAAYLSPAPPLDSNAASLYAVSPPPSDWPAERQQAFFTEYNRAMLQILTIHEAYPGHYVQLEYANRHPSLIRKVYSSGVFAEGWAVYTEQMMLDQGYAAGDAGVRLNQLKFYLRAVVNAILDTKMHCANLSDADAMQLLVGRAFQTEAEALAKVQRSQQSSCQLSTYFVGRNAFTTLRQTVQRSRGKDFHLDKYHEEVLSHGTLPVKYLPKLVK